MNKRTKFLLGIGIIAALVLSWQIAAFAVHNTGKFELEGNATNDAAVAGDDWDNVCREVAVRDATGENCSTTNSTTGATAVSWVKELNNNASIFTGGGSKDPEDISNWAWKDGAGGLPDKDNLQHSFAARYSMAPSANCTIPADSPAGTNCELLFFGSDRIDNSGDAHQAFWFLQNEVTLGDIKSGGGFNFEGVHANGDLLIISNFSNGGTTSTIFVYQWNDTDPDNLELLASATNANCAGAHGNFCGIVNPNTIQLPWQFTDKSGTTFDHDNNPATAPVPGALQGEFFEGGVNLSQLGLADECFATALSETRSSTSTTATLKDFTLGSFAPCKATMTTDASTTGTDAVTPGTSVTDTATITGAGTSPLKEPTGTVTFFLCGPGQETTEGTASPVTAAGCPADTGANIGTGTLAGGQNTADGIATATSPAVNAVGSELDAGTYCFRAEWPGDTNYPTALSFTNATDECFTVSQPTTITTEQKWLPQDTAKVTPATTDGTVVFTLYENGTCTPPATGTPVTFTDTDADNNGVFETDNDTYRTASTTISWSATFDPSGTEESSTTTKCERSDLTINNAASDFPPPQTP